MSILNHKLTNIEEIYFWIIVIAGIISFVLLAATGAIWIYYSWIKRENSKNWTGADLSRYMLDNANLQDVEVRPAWFYVKYWNFNKRRRTHKLRPWTFNRRSIWTLMEAGQQAYASTIREAKGKTFWLLFRVPGVIRFFGMIVGIGIIASGLFDTRGGSSVDSYTFLQWVKVGMGTAVIFISFFVAEGGRLWILYKNVPQIIEKAGFTEEEVKSIKRIYFWRFVIAVLQVIIEITKLVLQMILETQTNKSSK